MLSLECWIDCFDEAAPEVNLEALPADIKL
jgi:hypothetical protein